MKKFTLIVMTALVALSSVTAHAAGKWQIAWQGGTTEAFVDNKEGYDLNLYCNPDRFDTGIILTAPGVNLSSSADNYTLLFTLGNRSFQMVNPTTNVGASNWQAFWDTVATTNAKTLVVSIDGNPKAGSVVFSIDGLKSVLKNELAKGCFR